MDFQVGQYIENNGQIGLILKCYKYAYDVCVGEYASDFWDKDDTILESSKEAYDAQIAGNEAALRDVKARLRQKQQPANVYRWLCLECGTKHNATTCTLCGSDEKLHNTDPVDTDPSILAEVGYGKLGRTEPYAPGE